jgi:hypothetical protein
LCGNYYVGYLALPHLFRSGFSELPAPVSRSPVSPGRSRCGASCSDGCDLRLYIGAVERFPCERAINGAFRARPPALPLKQPIRYTNPVQLQALADGGVSGRASRRGLLWFTGTPLAIPDTRAPLNSTKYSLTKVHRTPAPLSVLLVIVTVRRPSQEDCWLI